MESMARILHSIIIIWLTGILEQQYIMTGITVIKFQAGTKLDTHTRLCFGTSTFSSIYK